MANGPLQLVAIDFDADDRFHGQIHAELDAVRGRGVIKLIDLLFVRKDIHGTISELAESDPTAVHRAHAGAALRRMIVPNGTALASPPEEAPEPNTFGVSFEDVQSIAAHIPPGAAAALALFEHAWAAGLADAIRAAGGHLVAQGILTQDAELMVGQEIAAMAHVRQSIDLADAVSQRALLDALAFAAVVEQATETGGGQLRTVVAAQALRILIDAGIVHSSDSQAALAALVQAGLVELGAVEEALASITHRPA
jgi:hypothetical protein